jgi:sirohydrochlorin ferrochelatase
MSGICADLHEARDRHDQTLYRLYLKWQRRERRVIVLTGASKPNGTALPDTFYEELARLAATTSTVPPPFATVDDAVRLTLEDRS